MCRHETSLCLFPEMLKGKPEAYGPDRIKKCHGETDEHPCHDSKKEE
jgi:hypothetical protein